MSTQSIPFCASLTYVHSAAEDDTKLMFERSSGSPLYPVRFNLKLVKQFHELSGEVTVQPYISYQKFCETNEEEQLSLEIFRPYPCDSPGERCFIGQAGNRLIMYFYLSDDNEIVHIDVRPTRLDFLAGDGFDEDLTQLS